MIFLSSTTFSLSSLSRHSFSEEKEERKCVLKIRYATLSNIFFLVDTFGQIISQPIIPNIEIKSKLKIFTI